MGHGGSKPRLTPNRHTTTVTVSPESPPLEPFVQVDFQDNVLPPAQHNLQWHTMGGGSSAETISSTSTFKPVCTVPVIDPPQHFADVDFQVKSYNPNTEYLPHLFKDESDDGYGSLDRLSPRESLRPKRIPRFPTPEVCDYVLSMNCKDTLNILYMAKELHTPQTSCQDRDRLLVLASERKAQSFSS